MKLKAMDWVILSWIALFILESIFFNSRWDIPVFLIVFCALMLIKISKGKNEDNKRWV